MTGRRLVLRKTRSHIPQLISLAFLLTVGVCFFITLFTITLRYEETAEQYFTDNGYADVTFYGAFTEESVRTLIAQKGVVSAKGRMVRDFREGDTTFRVIPLTGAINTPYLYDGRLPEADTECVLLSRNAKAMGLRTGDTITLRDQSVTITGLVASPEYVYLVQNERTLMAQPGSFAVLYVTEDFYPQGSLYPREYNELVARTGDGFSADTASQAVGASQTTIRDDQINHILYRNDLEEINTFAYIFPFLFAVLIAAVIYVMLSRTIGRDRKQIGTMKALGMSDTRIIGIYLSQFCLAAPVGGLLGCFSAMLVSDAIVGIFSSMFEVPTLGFKIYPALWAGSVLVAVALCAVSGWIALLSILPLLPANAMRPRSPKGGKRIGLERIAFLWSRLAWGTRYALKNALRNKGRFFAVVLGMCGSCALLVFSLGFYDSIGNTQDEYFRDFANYDAIISLDPQRLESESAPPPYIDSSYKALMTPVAVRGENHPLAIVEQGFDMVNIPAAQLQTGVIVPEYFAEQWDVGVGDRLEVEGYSVVVSAITPQQLGLTLYTGFDYIGGVMDSLPPVYNTLYVRSENMTELTAYLRDNRIDFSTNADDRTSFDSIMESMSVLIWFMIACSVALGFTVLYSVGLINLSAREYEYMFMGVMGYQHRGIMRAHMKETLLQLALAIPLGFLAGTLLLYSIKDEFSGSNFVISAAIHPQSYLLSALAVVGVTAVMAAVTSRHINRLDIVKGLKTQDE